QRFSRPMYRPTARQNRERDRRDRAWLLCTKTEENYPSLLLPLHRPPADVSSAEAIRPFDAVDRRIGARLRLAHGLTPRADIKDAPAIGENLSVLGFRAGVEDLDALDLGGRFQAFDDRALVVVAGVTFRRHHYGERRVRVPAQVEILQLPVARGQQ